jgi:hypothetical protein
LKPFDILLFDENDNAESLVGATDATFRVLKFIEDEAANAILDVDTASELAIDIVNSRLTVTMTTAQADALPVGTFVGQANIKISGKWFATDPFHVKVSKRFAPTL